MSKVMEAAAAFKAARAMAKARVSARLEEMVMAEVTEEMARLSVELHAAFNAGSTKEQLRRESGLYSSPMFDIVWDAVPYTGRTVKPGRAGVRFVEKPKYEGRYMLELVSNTESPLGKGVLLIGREGEAFPEPVNMSIHVRDNGEFYVIDPPGLGDWWHEAVYTGGEYPKMYKEVMEFIEHEGVENE